MKVNAFIEELNLKGNDIANLTQKISKLKNTLRSCFDIAEIKGVLSKTLLTKNALFKIISIPYEIKRSSCFIKLPLLNNVDIYENKLYKVSSLLILADSNTQNSLFYFKVKTEGIQLKINDHICIKNIHTFYENISENPYFFSNTLKYNWISKLNKNQLTTLVFYEPGHELDSSLLNIKDIRYSDNTDSIVYYINLEKDTERRKHIENYHYLSAIRINAISDIRGFSGLLKTNYYILKNLIDKNLLKQCPIIMEDDCLLLDNQEIFVERWRKYREFLINNWGKWNYFSGGSIYIEPVKIINKDPCIVECKYGLCTQFMVHSEKSSKKVIDYVNSNEINVGIDRLLSDRKDTFWVPYPSLSSQLLKDTNICKWKTPQVYLNILQSEFKKSQLTLKTFVEKNT